jgi:hypothetical protein
MTRSHSSNQQLKSNNHQQTSSPLDHVAAAFNHFRPDNLPPKSPHEQQQTTAQLAKHEMNARQKRYNEAERLTTQRHAEYAKAQAEQRRAALRDAAMAQCTQRWMRDVIPNWSNHNDITLQQQSRLKARQLIQSEGMTPNIRSIMWPLCLQNHSLVIQQYITHKQYMQWLQRSERIIQRMKQYETKRIQQLQQHSLQFALSTQGFKQQQSNDTALSMNGHSKSANHSRSNSAQHQQQQQNDVNLSIDDERQEDESQLRIAFHSIDTDCARTLPELSFFQQPECLLHVELQRLLRTYCVMCCEYKRAQCRKKRASSSSSSVVHKNALSLSYVQSMSYLAAHLLLYISNPYTAFTCFVSLVSHPLLCQFLKLEQQSLIKHYSLWNELLHTHCPLLATHCEQQGVTCDLYLVEWVLTLLTKSLAIDVVSQLWDALLIRCMSSSSSSSSAAAAAAYNNRHSLSLHDAAARRHSSSSFLHVHGLEISESSRRSSINSCMNNNNLSNHHSASAPTSRHTSRRNSRNSIGDLASASISNHDASDSDSIDYLYRLLLGMIQCCEATLLQASDLGQLLRLLKGEAMQGLDAHQVIIAAEQIKFTQQQLAQLSRILQS